MVKQFKEKIKVLYIGYKDITTEVKVKEIYKYKEAMDNPWLFDHRGESVESIVEYLITESNRLYNECIERKLDYIDIHNINEQKEEIKEIFEQVGGLEDGQPVITSCQAGITSSMLFTALEHIGNKNVRNYDGSYAEYLQHLKRLI